MSLPDAWVDRIFAKLTLTYGQRFLAQYAGIDLNAVKADWAHELRGLAQSPNAIAHALDHLPTDRPPNVLEFREACRRTPPPAFQQLQPPKASPEMQRKAMEAIQRPSAADPKAWAWRLKEREDRGGRLSLAQSQMWRAALGVGNNPMQGAA